MILAEATLSAALPTIGTRQPDPGLVGKSGLLVMSVTGLGHGTESRGLGHLLPLRGGMFLYGGNPLAPPASG